MGIGMSMELRMARLEAEIRAHNSEERDGRLVREAGGIRKDIVQSDKLGYDWLRYYVNDILVRCEYMPQDNPRGMADNPIEYSEDVPLIPNAYYTLSGVRKVWTGEAMSGASWEDERWEVF